jgi:hypothetical protein
MKKLILTCALLTSVSMLSFGQAQTTATTTTTTTTTTRGTAPTAEQAATARTKTYTKQLGLNEEQKKAIYQAELDYVKQDMMFREGGQEVPQGPAMQMMMMHDQKFKAALTADQYAKYDKNRAVPAPATMTH